MEQNNNLEPFAVKVIYGFEENYVYFNELTAESFLSACKYSNFMIFGMIFDPSLIEWIFACNC